MRSLILLTAFAFQAAVASPFDASSLVPEPRASLLCGNYSINPDQSLFIKSKRFAQDYPKNHDCSYNFTCTDYAASIIFNCSRFEIQGGSCDNDYMQVFDLNSIDDVYCGTDGPQDVITGENFLGVRFLTNGDDERGPGFFCKVRCVHVADKTTTTTTLASTTTPATTTPPTTTTTTAAPVITPVSAYAHCECGRALRSSRIKDGQATDFGEYPWHAGLITSRLQTPYCGATLVNDLYAITSADCAQMYSDFQILLGEHDWSMLSRVYLRDPAEVTIHPDYDPSTKKNNIAVIRLSSPINLNADIDVKPACLPVSSENFTEATAIGWGSMVEGGRPSRVLQEANLTVLPDEDCSADPATEICTGNGICAGDFGGPLLVNVEGQFVLAGVASQSKDCTSEPSVFTDVRSYLDWIEPIVEVDGKTCGDDVTTTTTTTSTTTTAATTTPQTSTTASPTEVTTPAASTTTTAATTTTTAATTTTTAATTTTTMATTAPATANPTLLCACGAARNPLRAAATDHINNSPWTVAIMSKSSGVQVCSGAVINTMSVLTAADCAAGTLSDLQVLANAQDISSEVTRRIFRDVASTSTNSDLAILKLSTPLSLTNWDGILPACMPSYSPDFTNMPAVHSGYGRLTPTGAESQVVKKVDGFFIWCSGLTGGRTCFQPAQAQGFCSADKGGPIVSERNGRQVLAGIALNDNGCNTSNDMLFQEVAKVSDYYQWIMDNSQEGRFCGL